MRVSRIHHPQARPSQLPKYRYHHCRHLQGLVHLKPGCPGLRPAICDFTHLVPDITINPFDWFNTKTLAQLEDRELCLLKANTVHDVLRSQLGNSAPLWLGVALCKLSLVTLARSGCIGGLARIFRDIITLQTLGAGRVAPHRFRQPTCDELLLPDGCAPHIHQERCSCSYPVFYTSTGHAIVSDVIAAHHQIWAEKSPYSWAFTTVFLVS